MERMVDMFQENRWFALAGSIVASFAAHAAAATTTKGSHATRRIAAAGVVVACIVMANNQLIDLAAHLFMLYAVLRVSTAACDFVMKPGSRKLTRKEATRSIYCHATIAILLAGLLGYTIFDPTLTEKPIIGVFLRLIAPQERSTEYITIGYLILCGVVAALVGVSVHHRMIDFDATNDWTGALVIVQLAGMAGLLVNGDYVSTFVESLVARAPTTMSPPS